MHCIRGVGSLTYSRALVSHASARSSSAFAPVLSVPVAPSASRWIRCCTCGSPRICWAACV